MNEEYTNPYYDPRWGSQTVAGYGDSSTYLDEPQSGGVNMNNVSGAASGAMSSISQPHDGFMPDRFAAQQGAAQGYAAGGAYGALAGAIAAPTSQVVKSHRNLNNLSTTVGATRFDAYGRPVYDGTEITNATNKLPELEKTANWDSTNILGLGRKAKRKRDKLIANVGKSQQSFNQSETQYRNRNLQLQEYFERMNNNRLQNLHTY